MSRRENMGQLCGTEETVPAGGRAFRLTVALVVLMVLLSALLWFRSGNLVGGPAPDFVLPDLNGKMVRLKNLRGKIVFLNIWATWCPPCREEMPAMERLYQRLRGAGFEMLAVSVDQDEAAVADFARELGLSFPILLDPGMTVTDPYEISGYPETFIIDRNGQVLTHEIGPASWDEPRYQQVISLLIEAGEWRGF